MKKKATYAKAYFEKLMLSRYRNT